MNMINKVLIALFFALAGTTSPVVDIPIERLSDGSFAVRAFRTMMSSSSEETSQTQILLILHLSSFSVYDYRYRENEVTIPGLVEVEDNNPFYQGSTKLFTPGGYPELIGIGPLSYIVALYDSIDVYSSGAENSFLRFGQSLDAFEASACMNRTLFDIGDRGLPFPNNFIGRFDLIDHVSETYLSDSFVGDIALEPTIGAGPIVTLPGSFATRIDEILLANGASRESSRASSIRSLWEYANCTSENLALLPILEIGFFEQTLTAPIFTGSIKLTPDVYMPNCKLSVFNGPVGNPSIDIFQIPGINVRISLGKMSVCDAITT